MLTQLGGWPIGPMIKQSRYHGIGTNARFKTLFPYQFIYQGTSALFMHTGLIFSISHNNEISTA
jgi:hypothetical protein